MPKISAAKKEMLNRMLGNEPETSTPEDDASPLTSIRREMAKARHVSLQQAAEFLDRDRNTVKRWLDKEDCPFVQRADRDLGKAWILDLAEVVRWLEKRAADATAAKMGISEDGLISEAEAKRRRAVALATVAEIEALEMLKVVVTVSFVTDRLARDYAELKTKMLTLPEIVSSMVDSSSQVRVRKEVTEVVSETLSSLKVYREFPTEDSDE